MRSQVFALRPRHVAAGLSVLALHLLLVQVFLPLAAVLQAAPLAGDDLDTHIGQTYRLITALIRGGHHWQYTPYLLAGFPAGAVFDADNKGWAYLTFALYRWGGLPPGTAFNLFIYLAAALPPVVGMTSAWLFGMTPAAVVVSGLFCSLYWHFDSFVHWCFWIGMEAYAFAGYFALLPLALFHRFVASGRVRYAALCAPVLAAAHTLHPYTFFILALPMGTLVVRNVRGFTRPMLAGLVGIVVTTVAVNLPWLWVSVRHWHYILNSAFFAQGGLDFLAADLFNQLISPTDTGVTGTRTAFRFGFGLLAAFAIADFVRKKDLRAQSLGVATAAMFFFGYLGAYIPGMGQIQPYRHVVPAGFMAALPAASAVVDAAGALRTLRLPPALKAAGCALCFLAAQHLFVEVGYFVPQLAPEVAPLLDGTRVHLDASGHPPRTFLGLPHDHQFHGGVNELVAYVAEHTGRSGRVVVEEMVLGERLAWREVTEVIGGFRLRNMQHSLCNIIRTHEGRVISKDELRRYVKTYGITHFIMAREHEELDAMPELLENLGEVHGRRVLAVRNPTPKLTGSPGHIQASSNRLRLTGTDPDKDLLLSYHFHPDLRCTPKCTVERADADWPDPVGFIRVPAPHPSDLLIFNGY